MKQNKADQVRNQLMSLLYQLESEQVWRPVVGPWGQNLFPGLCEDDHLLYSTPGLDFRDKTLVDFGCNLGFYTFQFRRMGAKRVLGLDKDEQVIEISRLLAAYLQVDSVDFQSLNLEKQRLDQTFDISVMIDVIGKHIVRSGRLHGFLDAMAGASHKEMFFTIRPIYSLAKHGLGSAGDLEALYPGGYVRDERFHLLEYVRDHFAKDWYLRIPKQDDYWEHSFKYAVHFIKK